MEILPLLPHAAFVSYLFLVPLSVFNPKIHEQLLKMFPQYDDNKLVHGYLVTHRMCYLCFIFPLNELWTWISYRNVSLIFVFLKLTLVPF